MKITKIRSKSINNNSLILKPNYHLNYGKKRIEVAINNENPFMPLGTLVKELYTGGIFKRAFVENEKFGLPYISAQHMMHFNPLEVAKQISKKLTPRQNDMTLRERQILLSCAGTVGNIRLIGADLDGVIGSQDIIRVIADNTKCPFGYIYAYLATPTAYNYIQSFIYGSVVPRIEPNTLAKLPVPIINQKIIEHCDKLINSSLQARDKAVRAINQTVNLLESKLPKIQVKTQYKVNISELKNYKSRIESTLGVPFLNNYYNELRVKGYDIRSIGEISETVYTPNIFKRIKVNEENGIPYLGGADLLNFKPKFDTYLSRGTKDIDDYILREGYIAVQDSGSIQSMGYVSLIPDYLNGVAATNNLVRIVPSKDKDFNPYIFAYLKTKQANTILKNLSYGTGQLHIDNNIIKDFRIPIIDELYDIVVKGIEDYKKHLEYGYRLENQAIALIEKEIDLWQVS